MNAAYLLTCRANAGVVLRVYTISAGRRNRLNMDKTNRALLEPLGRAFFSKRAFFVAPLMICPRSLTWAKKKLFVLMEQHF